MKRILLLLSVLLVAGASALHAQNPFYGIKSGHLKYETQTSGGIQYNEVWFDDYGLLRKQHDQIKMESMGIYPGYLKPVRAVLPLPESSRKKLHTTGSGMQPEFSKVLPQTVPMEKKNTGEKQKESENG